MKYILPFILSLLSISLFAQQEPLKLASDVWPPFTNVDDKKSIATDIVQEALDRIDYNSKIYILDFGTIISDINAGTYDGSAALWKNEEREAEYVFSEPYLFNQLILVGAIGSDVSATNFSQLGGKRIGIVENYAYDLPTGNAKLIRGASDQQNLERLLTGHIDYMLVDALLMQYLLKFQVNDVSEYLEVGQKPLVLKSLHFALNRNVENAEQIMIAFDDEIRKMMVDGTYNQILELNWIQADIDGDGKMEIVLDGKSAGKEAPRNVYGVDTSKSLAQQGDAQRYYVNGQVYDGWDKVPQEYKNQVIMSTQSVENYGYKLNFR